MFIRVISSDPLAGLTLIVSKDVGDVDGLFSAQSHSAEDKMN